MSKATKKAAMQNQSATILSESLDRIADAIFQLAHEIKHKQSAPAVVLSERTIEEANGEEMMTTPQENVQERIAEQASSKPRPIGVESQIMVDEENGSRSILTLRIWDDGRLRLDKKPFRTLVKSE